MSTANMLNVTGVTGRYTIFSETELSRQLGLSPGDPVPPELAYSDVLFWVDSVGLSGPGPGPEVAQGIRERMKLNHVQFEDHMGLAPGVSVEWESQPAELGRH